MVMPAYRLEQLTPGWHTSVPMRSWWTLQLVGWRALVGATIHEWRGLEWGGGSPRSGAPTFALDGEPYRQVIRLGARADGPLPASWFSLEPLDTREDDYFFGIRWIESGEFLRRTGDGVLVDERRDGSEWGPIDLGGLPTGKVERLELRLQTYEEDDDEGRPSLANYPVEVVLTIAGRELLLVNGSVFWADGRWNHQRSDVGTVVFADPAVAEGFPWQSRDGEPATTSLFPVDVLPLVPGSSVRWYELPSLSFPLTDDTAAMLYGESEDDEDD